MKILSTLIVLTTLLAVGIPLTIRNSTLLTPSQHFIGLGDLPGGTAISMASGVSADGTAVVGYGSSATGMEAFRWTRVRGMEGLGFPRAFATSADGAMVVGYRHIATRAEPVRWTRDGGTICLGQLFNHSYGSANGVSADGSVIVGTNGENSSYITFRWIAGRGIAGLPGLSSKVVNCSARAVSANGAVVVGESRNESDCDQAFRFHADTGLIQLGVLPGDSSSVADGVSADGSVIVGSSASELVREAFRWTKETGMVGLGTLPEGSRNSRASGVSADGSIIVGQCYGEGGFEAFIWDAVRGMRSVRQILVREFGLGANLRGWKLRGATGVSADGTVVVGNGINPQGNLEAWFAYLGDEHRPVTVATAAPAVTVARSKK